MYPPGSKRLTPVMQQYREAKEAYPDAILFFRLGDFYEMFNADAVLAAGELGLTLTSRNKGATDEVPMAGVPHHAAHGYIAKLIARGHKVAICEQLGDPSKMKGIVPRKVVRVVTPGLLTDEEQLDARRNNFLIALERADGGDAFGLALFDLSTGELAACRVDGRGALYAEIAQSEPAEALLAPELGDLARTVALAAPRCAVRHDEPLDDAEVERLLDTRVARPLYREARRDHGAEAVRAAARALRFAARYLPDASLPVTRIAPHDRDQVMRIDETAQAHLELVRGADGNRRGSLLDVIDRSVTAGGARLMRRRLLAPLCDVAAIRRRLDAVALFVAHPRAREELRDALGRVGDLERLAIRASLREASPRDLGALRDGLGAAPAARAAIASIPGGEAASALAATAELDLVPELQEELARALSDTPPPRASDGGILRPGYDRELDELRELRLSGARLIGDLELRLREQTGIASLKVKFTRGFGWYYEVTRANIQKAPSGWRRKQTLTSGERYSDDELDAVADKLVHAEERFDERESALFATLCERAAAASERVRTLAAVIAQWDVAAALADAAHRHGYCRPEVDDGERLELGDARHPVVERFVAAGRFVPNDTTLDLAGERLLLVTGPNMAGKSTLMRQVALCVVLAQMGSYVPAARAHVGVVDRVLSRVGASDNLARGESTFMVEMRETAAILRSATRRSLVILDEIGRGTSTFDGLSIAWAVAEHLHDAVGCRALFATHYHQLTELGERCAGIANYSVSAREHDGDIVFLHRLTPGAVSKSYGIAVARLAGLPETVLARAGAILAELEEHGAAAAPQSAERGREGSFGQKRGAPQPRAQLDLFHKPPPASPAEQVARLLRAVDPNRLTPLEALQLVGKLKADLSEPAG